MPGPDEKDELLKTPPASEQRTTPMGSSDPSVTIELPAGMDFDGARLAGVSARYELEAELGRGGMGIVYRARDKETNERVALKVLKSEIASEQALLDRFKNELKLARKITHKRVCRTYELLRFGDTVVIAMEYVEGESLRAVLERFGSMSTRKGIQITQQVCSALGEAHAQGIVHRDLKPENLMLDRAGNVKVMDFGIARSVETGATTTGNVIGTPAYMAPEQAEGKAVDARTDIYSLGLILYEMFTGSAAFRADTPLALAMKQIRETPPAPREVEPSLPAHVEKAIVKCLEKNPAKRFQSVEELEAALTRESEPAVAPEGAAGEEIPLPLHLTCWERSDWVILAVGVLAAVLSFVLYDRVLPFGVTEALVSREEAGRKTQALLAKYLPEVKEPKFKVYYRGGWKANVFPASVLALGLGPTLAAEQKERDAWWAYNERNGRITALNRKGDPVVLQDPTWEPFGNADTNHATVQEALPLARQVAEELFNAPVAALVPTPYTYKPEQRRWMAEGGAGVSSSYQGTPVHWILPGGKTEVLIVISRGKMALAEWTFRYPGTYYSPETELAQERWRSAASIGTPMLGAACLLALFLFVARRLDRQKPRLARAAALFPALLTASLACFFVLQESRTFGFELGSLLLPLAGFVFAFLASYPLFSVPEYYLGKALPTHLRSASDLLSNGLGAQPAGLAAIRGVLLGAAYLGLHLGLLLIFGNLKWGAAQTGSYGTGTYGLTTSLLYNDPGSGLGQVLFILLGFSIAIFATWLLVALPIGLLRRVTKRTPILLMAVALLWMAMAFSLPGAFAFPVLPLYLFAGLQGICFAWILLRYDLLTCFQAMLTVTAWLFCFPLLRIFMKVEFWTYVWVMVPWLLFTLLGVVLWFRPELVAWRRRTAAVFE